MSNTQKLSELLPCPFCGKQPRLRYAADHAVLYCESADCPIYLRDVFGRNSLGQYAPGQDPAAAITAWNTRAAPTPNAHSEVGVTQEALDAYDGLRNWLKAGEEADADLDPIEDDVRSVLDALKLSWRVPQSRPLTEDVLDDAIDAYHAASGKSCDLDGLVAAIKSCLTVGVAKAEPLAVLDVCVTGTNINSEYMISLRFAGDQFYEGFSLGRYDAMSKSKRDLLERVKALYPGTTASLASKPEGERP